MASLIEILKTSAEEDKAKVKMKIKIKIKIRTTATGRMDRPRPPKASLLAWRLRRGWGRAPSKQRQIVFAKLMAATPAALSPRAWLLECVSNPGRRNWQARVAGPD